MSPIRVDEDLLPTSVFAIHLTRLNQPAGWLVGEFSLEEMWRMVDRIRIGDHGYAMVVAPGGELIAHGDPDKKALVAQARNMSGASARRRRARRGATRRVEEYVDEDGRGELGVAARIPPLGWTVIVEQPTAEAYANATQLQRQLVVAISMALLVMISVGYLFGRSFINPILTLKRATQDVAAGQLETRVDIRTGDEFGELGDAFNTMADRLVELQEDVKRQERQAMFGRVAAGLVHDLSHPIQNIGNSTRLLLRDDVGRRVARDVPADDRARARDAQALHGRPAARRQAEADRALRDGRQRLGGRDRRVDARRRRAQRRHRRRALRRARSSSKATASRSAACTATSSPTRFRRPSRAAASRSRRRASAIASEISVADTGSGIPADRLSAIFDDFVTTKRRGLGLGLAISKRIVEQLDGTIAVESEVGRGTAFTLRFPGARRSHGAGGCQLNRGRPAQGGPMGGGVECSGHS